MKYIKLFEEHGVQIKIIKKEDVYEFIATIGSEKVGSLRIQYETYDYVWFEGIITQEEYDDLFDGDPYYIIEDVRVNSDKQGQKIGTMLMNKAIDKIVKIGVKAIVINACPIGHDIPLPDLVQWYIRLGFKVFKKQKGNVIMIKRL